MPRHSAATLAARPSRPYGLTFVLLWIAAAVLLFEEWFWVRSTDAIARFVEFAHLTTIGAWVRRRPPAQALALFVVPVLVIYPFKVLALQGSYARSDLSTAYNRIGDPEDTPNRKLDFFYRNFLYLRASNSFVVYDQVQAKPSINARHCGALRHVAEGVLVDSTPTRYVFGADCASAAVTLVTATAKTRIAFRLILLP